MTDPVEVASRFAFHPADTPERVAAHETIRSLHGGVADKMVALLPESREKALALTALQEAAQWANAAVAIHFPHAHE